MDAMKRIPSPPTSQSAYSALLQQVREVGMEKGESALWLQYSVREKVDLLPGS